jgi:GT2 family glycosyltransferase
LPPITCARPFRTAGPGLSFVIPARNEERFISRTIESIHAAVEGLDHEIIVVDNGSTDRTAELASNARARVERAAAGTIGSARNHGVRHSSGSIIVFLDADVMLTPQWAQRIPSTIALLMEQPDTITGSICGVPADAGWLERVWFAPRVTEASSHVGSGHMILTRSLFERTGGFDESLDTGEDYDLSRRALTAGGRIVLDAALRVEHLGFPRTVGAFLRREIWHGRSDFRSLKAILSSRVALASLLFLSLHVLLGAGIAFASATAVLVALMAIAMLCWASAMWKYRRQPATIVAVNSAVFWIYYWGRVLAALSAVRRGPTDGGPRAR